MEILLLYGKRSKILNTFLFLFSNKMLVFRAGIWKILARIANREDPDQLSFLKQSNLGLHCLSRPFSAGNYCSKCESFEQCILIRAGMHCFATLINWFELLPLKS